MKRMDLYERLQTSILRELEILNRSEKVQMKEDVKRIMAENKGSMYISEIGKRLGLDLDTTLYFLESLPEINKCEDAPQKVFWNERGS